MSKDFALTDKMFDNDSATLRQVFNGVEGVKYDYGYFWEMVEFLVKRQKAYLPHHKYNEVHETLVKVAFDKVKARNENVYVIFDEITIADLKVVASMYILETE